MSAVASVAGRRRLTQGELDMIVTAHERFVTGKPGGKRASLRFVDLSGLDLSGRNLTDADFSASVLDGCRMVRTQLERANLFGCDLRKADLRQAEPDPRRPARRVPARRQPVPGRPDPGRLPRRPDRHTPPPQGAGACRHETRDGRGDGVNFSGATLDGSQFGGVSAFAADFSDCSMRGAKLPAPTSRTPTCRGAMLDGADVGGCNLEGANLQRRGDDRRRHLHRPHHRGQHAGRPGGARRAAPWIARPQLIERAKANQAWCETGGKRHRPPTSTARTCVRSASQLKGCR